MSIIGSVAPDELFPIRNETRTDRRNGHRGEICLKEEERRLKKRVRESVLYGLSRKIQTAVTTRRVSAYWSLGEERRLRFQLAALIIACCQPLTTPETVITAEYAGMAR